jgi:hypothetical protein
VCIALRLLADRTCLTARLFPPQSRELYKVRQMLTTILPDEEGYDEEANA